MGILSNLLGFRDGRSPSDGHAAVIRTARADEIDAAVRIVLGGSTVQIGEQHVQEFIAYAHSREIDLGGVWIAEQHGKIAQAVLPIVSPGRTMLLLSPPHLHGGGSAEHVMKRIIDAACRAGAQKNIHLAQALVDPHEESLHRVYRSSNFVTMAELIYLQADVRPDASFPTPPPEFSWEVYSDRTHALFAQAILASYENSLDCPALNGMRDMEDVILGHKATGDFDPSLWFLLCRAGQPAGVLLLAASSRNDLLELVYLGLTREARGRKLGEVLMRQALAVTALEKRPRLTLAVDSLNIPALKLYYRHGMSRLASKYALMRNLSTTYPHVL